MKKRSTISIPSSVDLSVKKFAESVKENVDVMLGHRGNPLDRAVTWRDLSDSKVVTVPSSGFTGSPSQITLPTPGQEILDEIQTPTNLTASGAFQNILLGWNLVLYRGHSHVEIWRHTSDSLSDASLVGISSFNTGLYADNVGSNSTNRNYYYWVRAVNTAGQFSAFNASAGTLGTLAADVDTLIDTLENSIPAVAFANGIEPISVVNALPTVSGYTGPPVVLLTTDGKLYRLVSGAWTAAVPTGDLSGQIGASQLAANSVTANAIQAGAIQAGAISAGAVNATNIIADGVIVGDKIAANTITGAKIQAGTVNADRIQTGTLSAAQIATGTLDTSRLNIDGSTLTSSGGVLQVGNLNADKINIDNVSITNDNGVLKIKDLGVDTLQIKNQAVTIPSAATRTSTLTLNSYYSWYDVVSITFTSTGSPVFISWDTLMSEGASGDPRIGLRLLRGSTTLTSWSSIVLALRETYSGSYLDSGNSSGSITYKLQARRESGSSTSTYVEHASISTIEVKK